MRAINLQCEHLIDPVGIDRVRPWLFWNCADGIRQTAYRIVARDEAGRIAWDSGKVLSGSMRATYAGRALISRDQVVWHVQLWDEHDNAGDFSAPASFELGLLEPGDWQAAWITGAYQPRKKRRYPVDCLDRSFTAGGSIAKARLYVTACGLYEGRLNGRRIGDFVLAPGLTDYTKRVQVQTYDVTDLVLNGENHLTFELADGWYRGSVGAWGLRNQYGRQTKLLAQLEWTDSQGRITTIGSDANWAWSNDGPIRQADNKDGEIVDARLVPSYAGQAKVIRHEVVPTASNNVPITEHERFQPSLITTPGGKTVLDFGQNMAGYVSFDLTAQAGQTIRLRFGELLDADGEFTQQNIQLNRGAKTTPLQQVLYTCRDGRNSYQTKFAVFGFRYVLVDSEIRIRPDDFTAIAVYSDLRHTADFSCSNELLNQFVKNTLWSAKSNSLDIPTDCPTRERHGWTGDAQIFSETASYLFHYAPFARKYIRDIYDWQKKDGKLPQIVPAGGVDFYMRPMNGSVGWADAGIVMPYLLWKQYGDEQVLRDHYDGMRRYARFMQRRCGKNQLLSRPLHLRGPARRFAVNKGQAYGEWAEPKDVRPIQYRDMAYAQPEVATAYTCRMMELMEEMALHLGCREDAAEYRTYADGTRLAYQELIQTAPFTLDTDRQARLVRPLYFRLLDPEQRAYARQRLIQALDHYGWRVGTGFLSTPLILDVLTDIDLRYAYRLLENEAMPGWLFMPKNGATTVWEAWEGTLAQGGIASLNHVAKGACCAWVFHTLCGIRLAGENRFVIAPQPGGQFTQAHLIYDSLYGTVESGWQRTETGWHFTVRIPANCSAQVKLPDGTTQTVEAGEYVFESVGD